ncbi:MAG: alkaline phosphatase D family protein [Acidimicrobiales bacterium]
MPPSNDPLSRRGFLAASAGLVAAACSGNDEPATGTGSTAPAPPESTTVTQPSTTTSTTSTTLPVPEFANDPFPFGVASGDPLPDAVVIWTRLAVDPMAPGAGIDLEQVPVRWEIGPDGDVSVADGEFVTNTAHGHSVHVDVTGLEPSTDYWYRFHVGDHTVAGMTRTAPAPGASVDSVRLAVASCMAWKSGRFTPLTHLTQEGADAVIFVGDYIYELESGTFRDHGLPVPYSLDEYRSYYAVARLEPELAECHGNVPWIVMWDDHEVEDNYAGWEPGGIGSLLDPTAAASFRDRRIAAYQAWWEFMPVRTGPPVDGELTVYRDFAFGDLVHLALVDDRQYRSPIVQGEGNGNLPRPFGGGPQLDGAFDESRTMLGVEQEEWLAGQFDNDARWTIVAQQTIMAEVNRAPDDPTKGFSMDAWDGYVAPRERLLGAARDAGVENLVVLGGDIHTSAVADLHVSYHDPDSPMVGTEFVAPSITSLELLLPEFVEGSRRNEHIHLYETEHRGYLVVDITADDLTTHFRWVDTTQAPTSPIRTASSWRVTAGTTGVERLP